MAEALKQTPLATAHSAAGGRMVPFAGYAMPVQYPEGIMAEHRWTREHAGAFDVSHMGPAFMVLREISGDAEADHARIAAIAEKLVPGDILGLKPGQLRYTMLLNAEGGMLDDLMIGRPRWENRQGLLTIVANAAMKEDDFALFQQAAGDEATLVRADDRALVAVQGPEAAAVVQSMFPEAAELTFMTHVRVDRGEERFLISRSGYTGEDGYEILIPAALAAEYWERLLDDERVKPIGLGARDSLRLEAGLPLYGHDADATTSPIEAGLAFAVSKRRRRDGDFPGARRIERELNEGPQRLRVGLNILEGAPAREGAEIANEAGAVIGKVTSGGFSPTLGRSIAMGYVPPAYAKPGFKLKVIVRGKPQAAEVTDMPFVPHRYVRKA
jgi:aminomethyltransferase